MKTLKMAAVAVAMTVSSTAAFAQAVTETGFDFDTTFNEWASGGGSGVALTSVADVNAFETSLDSALLNHETAIELNRSDLVDLETELDDFSAEINADIVDIEAGFGALAVIDFSDYNVELDAYVD